MTRSGASGTNDSKPRRVPDKSRSKKRRAMASASTSDSDSPYASADADPIVLMSSDEDAAEMQSQGRTSGVAGYRGTNGTKSKGKGKGKGTARGHKAASSRASPSRKRNTNGREALRKHRLTRSSARTSGHGSEDRDASLVDSDSSGMVSEDGAGGGGGGGPVRCRCGDIDREDGRQWIRCDGRECWTWEHLRCAYPRASHAPRVHLCRRCARKGPSVVRSLTRGAGDEPGPHDRPPSGTWGDRSPGQGSGGKAGVRRSNRRVGGQLGIRSILQGRRLVGAGSAASSSSTESGVGGGGGGSSDSDAFFAPEGTVEEMKEYRCRCGATREDQGPGGARAGKGLGSSEPLVSRWVQCHADSCGVWEHAACCDRGCSEAGDATSRGRRHWCRTCDPKGNKHARDWEKRRARARPRREADAVGDAAGPPGKPAKPRGAADGLDEEEAALARRLWEEVASGDWDGLQRTLRVAGRRGESFLDRLWEAGSPARRLRHGGEDDETLGANLEGGEGGFAPGVTLLMLAVGGGHAEPVPERTPARGGEACDLTARHGAEAGLGSSSRVKEGAGRGETDTRETPADEKARGGLIPGEGTGSHRGSRPPGGEERLRVLRTVLDRCTAEQVLRPDAEGSTAAHHAARANAASEMSLLLEREPGRKAATTRVSVWHAVGRSNDGSEHRGSSSARALRVRVHRALPGAYETLGAQRSSFVLGLRAPLPD